MGAERFARKPLSERQVERFADAEEAWLWFSHCQLARIEGVRLVADLGRAARPCDPDDIYCAVDRLVRSGHLSAAHISVLGRFGCRLAAPDPLAGDGAEDARLWHEAMLRLTPSLQAKGIVT